MRCTTKHFMGTGAIIKHAKHSNNYITTLSGEESHKTSSIFTMVFLPIEGIMCTCVDCVLVVR